MIVTDLVWFALKSAPYERSTLNHDYSPMRRSLAEAHLAKYPHPPQIMIAAPTCLCCGSIDVRVEWPDGWRCERHRNSTPCQVIGCKRSASRERYSETICGPHWRAGVPVGSEARRVWLRFRRIVKRYGWTPEREARSDRLWAWLKRRCQAAADGDLDQREIDRLFGW